MIHKELEPGADDARVHPFEPDAYCDPERPVNEDARIERELTPAAPRALPPPLKDCLDCGTTVTEAPGICPKCQGAMRWREYDTDLTRLIQGACAVAAENLARAERAEATLSARWQPIETAPTDGMRILGRWDGYPLVQIVACDADGVWVESNSQRSSPPPDGWLALPAVKEHT